MQKDDQVQNPKHYEVFEDLTAIEIIACSMTLAEFSVDYVEKVLASGEAVQVVNSEHIQRSRLRVDTRKWVASKLLPKRYGDKQEVDVKFGPAEQLKELMDMVKPTLGPPAYRNK